MRLNQETGYKEKILLECNNMGWPVNYYDEIKTLEIAHSLAITNNLKYSGDGSDGDRLIDNIIDRIRRYVKKNTSRPS